MATPAMPLRGKYLAANPGIPIRPEFTFSLVKKRISV